MRKAIANEMTMRVAKLVGWRFVEVTTIPNGEVWGYREPRSEKSRVPDYATDCRASQEVLAWINSKGYFVANAYQDVGEDWRCDLVEQAGEIVLSCLNEVDIHGRELPELFCRAALALARRLDRQGKVGKG